ncbi:MAG: hypothetical protein ACKOEI_09085 [Chthoniobacterales bacterium]
MTPPSDITFQINLCAGDADYSGKTLPALIATCRDKVAEVLIVLDECYPQASPVFRPAERFSQELFRERLEIVRDLCRTWKQQGLVDRVESLKPGDALIAELNSKYTGEDTPWTHDHWGHAFTAYFAAWDFPRTRFVLHSDADIFLHDATAGAWISEACDLLKARAETVALSPRIAPPPENDAEMIRHGCKESACLPTWTLKKTENGWASNWPSTRFHLIDRDKLGALLPLNPTMGKVAQRSARRWNELLAPAFTWRSWTAHESPDALPEFFHRVLRKAAHHWIPPYPLPPEVLLFERAAAAGRGFFYLDRKDAWYVHPETKPKEFFGVLDDLLARVPVGGFPESQRGLSGIVVGEWAALRDSAEASGC